MKYKINLTVNGQDYELEVESDERLVDVLRERLNLTGTKTGCDVGVCGACTVIVDNMAVNSCLMLAVQADGKSITTIEGIADRDKLHPIQKAFVENGGIQCGFCSPGMIMSAKALLDENPNANEEEIKEAIAGNLCRCTGYIQIVDSIKSVSGHATQEPHVVAFRSEEGDRGD